MPPNGKQLLKKQQASQLPPMPEKKSRRFWVGIIIAILGLIGAGLYFSGKMFQAPPLETAGIYSASGKILSVSPENNSFALEIEVPLRYQGGETKYAFQQKTVLFGLDTQIFNEQGVISAEVFFNEAKTGDMVYISSDNFLHDSSFAPDLVILHPDRINAEAGGVLEGEEAGGEAEEDELLRDIGLDSFYINE